MPAKSQCFKTKSKRQWGGMDEEPLKGGLKMPFKIIRRGQKSQDIAKVDQEYKSEQKSLVAGPSFFEKHDEAGEKEKGPQAFPYRKA